MPHEEYLNPLPPGDRELERALAGLIPAPPPDHREAIAYEAGRRAGRRAALPWRITSGSLAALLALALLPHPTPPASMPLAFSPPIPPPPHLPISLASASDHAPLPDTYLAIRQDVLDHGLDALPSSTGGGSSSHDRPAPRAIDIQTKSLQFPTLFGGRS